jgi:hypothetical protein
MPIAARHYALAEWTEYGVKAMQPIEGTDGNGESLDSDERVRDFWSRHGGPAARRRSEGVFVAGNSGWSEVYAADGYIQRCEWSRLGSKQEMQYTERPPPTS